MTAADLRDALRSAISNAYYENRGKGQTMETAADAAVDAVLPIIAAATAEARAGLVEAVAPAINGVRSTGWLMDSLSSPEDWDGRPSRYQWLYDAILIAGKAVDAALAEPEP